MEARDRQIDPTQSPRLMCRSCVGAVVAARRFEPPPGHQVQVDWVVLINGREFKLWGFTLISELALGLLRESCIGRRNEDLRIRIFTLRDEVAQANHPSPWRPLQARPPSAK